MNPGDPKTYNNLGNAYMALDERTPPRPPIGRPFSSIPTSWTRTAIWRCLFTRQEQYGDALSELNRALALDSRNVQVYLQLGELYYRMGQYDKGLQQFRKAQSLKPDSAEAYLRHGDLPEQAGADQ